MTLSIFPSVSEGSYDNRMVDMAWSPDTDTHRLISLHLAWLSYTHTSQDLSSQNTGYCYSRASNFVCLVDVIRWRLKESRSVLDQKHLGKHSSLEVKTDDNEDLNTWTTHFVLEKHLAVFVNQLSRISEQLNCLTWEIDVIKMWTITLWTTSDCLSVLMNSFKLVFQLIENWFFSGLKTGFPMD